MNSVTRCLNFLTGSRAVFSLSQDTLIINRALRKNPPPIKFLKMEKIYLDYAATTPVDEKVEKAMRPYFSASFGNAGSLHSFGRDAVTAIDSARDAVAQKIGADFRDVIFTGSATEANN